MDSSMAPPKTRPFRLNVEVLPPDASRDTSIRPVQKFLLLTSRGTTIRNLCPDISAFYKDNYSRDLNIKKCQTKDGADLALDHSIEDIFDDKETIRVIQSYATPSIRDSVPPTSGLRPATQLKRARSQSLRPVATGGLSKIVEERESPAASPGTVRPNKRQRILDNDPDRPIRSRERDTDELREPTINGRRTPVLQVEDSQGPASIVEETQTGADSTRNSIPKVNGTSDTTLGSPFHEPHPRNLSRALSTDPNRSGRNGDRTERLRVTSTAITTPQSVNAQQAAAITDPTVNGRLRRPDASTIRSKPKPTQRYPSSQQRHDIYDDIETDGEEDPNPVSSKVGGFPPVDINGSRQQVKVNGVKPSLNAVEDMDIDEPANGINGKAKELSPRSAAGLAAEKCDLEGKRREATEKETADKKSRERDEEEQRERVLQAAVDAIKQAEEAAMADAKEARLEAEAEKIRAQAEKEIENEEAAQQQCEEKEKGKPLEEERKKREVGEDQRKSLEEERQENLRQSSRERSQKEAADRKKRDESVKHQKEVEADKESRRKSEKAAETARAVAKKVEIDAAKSNARTPLKTVASRLSSSQAFTDSPATAKAKIRLWTEEDNVRLVVAQANHLSWTHMADKYFPTRTPKAVAHHFAELKKKPGAIDGIKAKGLKLEDLDAEMADEEETTDLDSSDESADETRSPPARTPVKSKNPDLPNFRDKTPSSIMRRTSSKTSPFPAPSSRNGSSIPRSSQEPLDVSLEAQMPLPPRRSVSFAEDISPSSGQKQPARTTTTRFSASTQPSNTSIPPPPRKSPGTLRQTQIIKPQLRYTGALMSTPPEKAVTRASSKSIVPSARLTSQPPLSFTPAGAPIDQRKSKEVIELSSEEDISDSDDYEDDDGGVNLASPDKKRAYVPNPIIPASLQMPSSQLPRGRLTRSENMIKSTFNSANSMSTPSILNKNQKPTTPSDPTPKRSDSTPASPPRDSHSPVGFRESHHPSPVSSVHKPNDPPTKSNVNDSEEEVDDGSSDNGSEYEDATPRHRSSHSPPIYLNTQEENDVDVDDSENELPPPKSSASTHPVYNRVDPTSERDLDALVQSQIRRDTSPDRPPPSTQSLPPSNQTNGAAPGLARPVPSSRHRYSLQRMNQNKPKVDYAAMRAASSQKKAEPIEEEEEEEDVESDSTSDSDSDSSDSNSDSDSDDAGKIPASTQPLPKKKRADDGRQLLSDGATSRVTKRGAGNDLKKRKGLGFTEIANMFRSGMSQTKR